MYAIFVVRIFWHFKMCFKIFLKSGAYAPGFQNAPPVYFLTLSGRTPSVNVHMQKLSFLLFSETEAVCQPWVIIKLIRWSLFVRKQFGSMNGWISLPIMHVLFDVCWDLNFRQCYHTIPASYSTITVHKTTEHECFVLLKND